MRNHLNAARAQNRALWGELVPSTIGYQRAWQVQCEENADRSQAEYLRRRDARLRERLRDAIDFPGGFQRSQYFRLVPVLVMSADDAVRELTIRLRKEQSRIKRKHWSTRNHSGEVEEIKEAMAFARWFRRHGKRVWMKQREAA